MSDVDTSQPSHSEPTAAELDADGTAKSVTDEHSHDGHQHHRMQRRRSSSGSKHEYKPGGSVSSQNADLKSSVEFVRPIEGTPAAEALAANKLIKVSKVSKGFHKLRGMKRPKMKNFNFMKKLNKTTKTKRKKKHFSKNFKGKVIDGVHELYTLTAGIMLGIRYTVGNAAFTAATVSVPDFTSVNNLAFPPNGSTDTPVPTPPHDLAHTFKFKSYAPKIFHRLREFFDISASAYMDSVCGDYNFIEFISNSKSGQFFFYSHDGQYMLKTQTKEENKFMIRILPHYYQYLTENPHSLLVRILGMHRIKMYHLRRKVHFVVMTSVFDTPAQINTIYDLKGSLIGRSASPKERENGGVLKDNDLISDNCKLHLGEKKAAFMAQLEKDAMFLAKLNIMDYSLLVGIHDRKLRTRDTLIPGRESAQSVGGGNAAVIAAAAASGALAPAAGAGATTTDSGAGMAGVHVPHTHSNTPFRRASLPQELAYNLAVAGHAHDANAPPGAHPSSPPTARKKRASTLQSNSNDHHTKTPGSLALELDGVTLSMDEDPGEHSLVPAAAVAGMSTATMSSGSAAGHNHAHSHAHTGRAKNHGSMGQAPESESEADPDTETEGEGEEGEEGDGEELYEETDEDTEYEDVDAGDSDDEHTTTQQSSSAAADSERATGGELVVEDGVGALGAEGYKLAELLRSDAVIHSDKANTTDKTDKSTSQGRASTVTNDSGAPVFTYGPGQARKHPWTSRKDEGINSRTPDGKRGDEIYYLGVIDILQQYNSNKRMETLIKGVTNDSNQISSVSPKKYARRFVSFMNSNID